jgi:hypothetical protein
VTKSIRGSRRRVSWGRTGVRIGLMPAPRGIAVREDRRGWGGTTVGGPPRAGKRSRGCSPIVCSSLRGRRAAPLTATGTGSPRREGRERRAGREGGFGRAAAVHRTGRAAREAPASSTRSLPAMCVHCGSAFHPGPRTAIQPFACAGAREGGHSRGRPAGVLHRTPPGPPLLRHLAPAPPVTGGSRAVATAGSSAEPPRWRTATMAHRPNRIVRASAGRSRAPSDRRHHVDDGPRVLELRSWAASPLCARAAEGQDGAGTAARSCRRHRVKRRGWFIPRTATGCPSRS